MMFCEIASGRPEGAEESNDDDDDDDAIICQFVLSLTECSLSFINNNNNKI